MSSTTGIVIIGRNEGSRLVACLASQKEAAFPAGVSFQSLADKGFSIHESNPISPTGDCVDIGAGAVLLGHIRIGDGSVIGANAVVLDDVPPGSLAVGVPARIIDRRERGA
jgi:hypothetical protein